MLVSDFKDAFKMLHVDPQTGASCPGRHSAGGFRIVPLSLWCGHWPIGAGPCGGFRDDRDAAAFRGRWGALPLLRQRWALSMDMGTVADLCTATSVDRSSGRMMTRIRRSSCRAGIARLLDLKRPSWRSRRVLLPSSRVRANSTTHSISLDNAILDLFIFKAAIGEFGVSALSPPVIGPNSAPLVFAMLLVRFNSRVPCSSLPRHWEVGGDSGAVGPKAPAAVRSLLRQYAPLRHVACPQVALYRWATLVCLQLT